MFLILAFSKLDFPKVPVMGWNSWNKFGCEINETLIKETADSLVSTGLARLGYKYLNLDDCWEAPQRVNGRLSGHLTTFPSGMKSLGEYIHSKGLKYGIYSSAGTKTCEGRPASLHHEKIDAETFESWEIDYLKYDNCHSEGISSRIRFKSMGDALKSVKRSIFFSACQWGEEDPSKWMHYAQSWRTTGDIKDNYYIMHDIIIYNDQFASYAKKGQYNDPDMLEVGVGHMTYNEYKTHFSLWSIVKSPLLIGCDITKMTPQTKEILMNEEVIAINQDPLGVQGRLIHASTSQPTNSDVFVRKCLKSPDQMWKINSDNTIRNGDRCLASKGKTVYVGDCQSPQKWNVTRVANRFMLGKMDNSDQCVRVWNDGFWNGPNLVMAPCKRELHQAFNITSEGYIRWNFVLGVHMPEHLRTNDGCFTVDGTYEKEVWGVPLSGGRYAVLLHNRGLAETRVEVDFSSLGLSGKWMVRDLWRKMNLGTYQDSFWAGIQSHDSMFLLLTKV